MEKFKRNNWENTYEVSSASRPRRGHAHRRRRQDRRRDYHSRYREGETLRRRDNRHRSRWPRRERQVGTDRPEDWRPRAIRKMVRHRGQDRRRRLPHHEGERHHGRARSIGRPQEGRLSTVASSHLGEKKWLLKT